MNINIDVISDIEDLKYIVRSYDIIVDAIFGTGISGTVRGISYDVISEINDNAKYIMAVDVPSGINSDAGEICGVCIKADKTVTLRLTKSVCFSSLRLIMWGRQRLRIFQFRTI